MALMRKRTNFEGDMWCERTARLAFPVIVAYAESGRPLTYKLLDAELHRLYRTKKIKRLTVYGTALGVIGYVLGSKYSRDVPPINALVVNQSGLPGHGCDYFIRQFLPEVNYYTLSSTDKRAVIDVVHEKIRNYKKWLEILSECQLGKPPQLLGIKIRRKRRFGKNFSGEGESEEHRILKNFVSKRPDLVDLPSKCAHGLLEKPLFSGDKPDVFFSCRKRWVAVEVKSRISNDDDLNRGLFQCVKYRAVLRAEQLENGDVPNADAFLVYEKSFPKDLCDKAELFDVRVFDKIQPK